MSDQFPLRPDAAWHRDLANRFGDAVPPLEHIQIRGGLQPIIFDMFMQLGDLDLLQHVDILGIVTRSAAWTVIDARYRDGICKDDRNALDFAFEVAQERLAAACEHCGKLGEIVAKTGLEALLEDPDTALGDRFLCRECYQSWRSHD